MKTRVFFAAGLAAVFCAVVPFHELAAEKKGSDDGKTACRLSFSLKSWSVFYKSGKGQGTITCDNGQSSRVKIRTHGGGVTFGESQIEGDGTFSKVKDIKELFGGYAESEAHAGASSSANAKALWNGDILLTLSGTGKGWDLGFSFGKFKIMAEKDKKKD
ncbi:MAG TPA: hypothetical protein VLJ37_11010 [bacterium]|nr:hypothetical protein [bacterium]